MPTGRFAPSPTAPLHLGNLRTALVAWLFARSTDSPFLLRIEDLDRQACRPEHEASQRRDLTAIGLEWDEPVLRQSERFDRYLEVTHELIERGLTYPCYCTRREVLEAAAAPHEHLPEGAYPGTCRELTAAQQSARATEGRPAALRVRADERRRGVRRRAARSPTRAGRRLRDPTQRRHAGLQPRGCRRRRRHRG